MSTQQPEALRLAEIQSDYSGFTIVETQQAQAELRRLHALNAELLEAGKSVISWTEAAHRPPVRDDMEFGRMVSVRLHALADLYAAISKAEGREA
jgi:hypothetical protein